ncbi:MAG: hypothetical protein ABSG92_02865 [Conexivisphaerales archaeon]|jgi:hypothetical protein
MSTCSIDYAVLRKFLDGNKNEYSVKEDDREIVITFSPASGAARGKLGSSTYIRVLGEKKGSSVEIVRLTVIEDDEANDVSVESLDGWLNFVKNVF